MGLLGAASDKAQFELLPSGEYVFTLWNLTLETGQWGDQVKWVFLISDVGDPDTYILRGTDPNAQEKELWQFTKIGLPKGSRAREWSEALMGRELKLGEEPEDSDLIRHRMIAYLVHKPKKSDPTIKQEAIAEGSAKPFRTVQPAKRGAAPVAAAASDDDVEAQLAASDALRKRVTKLIRNADLDDIGHLSDGTEIATIDVSSLADSDLVVIEKELKAAILAAA